MIIMKCGQSFEEALTCLLAYFLVFNLPYSSKNEKSIGFFHEMFIDKSLFPVSYEKERTREHTRILCCLQQS